MSSTSILLIVVLAVFVVAACFWLAWYQEKKKREMLQAVATRLGLAYAPGHDRKLAYHYAFLGPLGRGSNQYASHALSGNYRGFDILAFEYHYEMKTSGQKGQSRTQHYYLSVYTLALPGEFPALTIRPEGFLSKIAQAVGYDDIDFESAEFSRRYCVRSTDKRFAYDVCHPRAIEYVLAQGSFRLDIGQSTLAIVLDHDLSPREIEGCLEQLADFRELIPAHLLPAS